MIIMEYLDGISLSQGLEHGMIKADNDIYDNVVNAIELLHNENLVFADLRTPNIMIVEIDRRQQAKLIDFDWCGIHNKDRYPPSMNLNIEWPSGASPNSLLHKDHDIYWIKNLQNRFKEYMIEHNKHQKPQLSPKPQQFSKPQPFPKPQQFSKSQQFSKPQLYPKPQASKFQLTKISELPSTSTYIPQDSTASGSVTKKCNVCDCVEYLTGIYRKDVCINCFHKHN
jgi:hypothetical protein